MRNDYYNYREKYICTYMKIENRSHILTRDKPFNKTKITRDLSPHVDPKSSRIMFIACGPYSHVTMTRIHYIYDILSPPIM